MNDDNGVKNFLEKLDKLYLKDDTHTAYETYEGFETVSRAPSMTVETSNLKLGKTSAVGNEDTEDYSFRLVISLELYIFTSMTRGRTLVGNPTRILYV